MPNCRELLGRKVRLLWTKDDTEVYFRIQVHMEISQFAGKFRLTYLYYKYYRIVPNIVLEIVKTIVKKLSKKLSKEIAEQNSQIEQ